MLPWIQHGTAAIPGGGELRLQQRGDEFWIMAGNIALMNSRMSGSEEALATLAAERLAGRKNVHVLIGGLGMGFTLRAALKAMPEAKLTVSELVPGVVAWARGPLAPLFAGSLDDPRVTIETMDVARLIGRSRAVYDAILLDVDNGPDGLSQAANDRLYAPAGLAEAKAALKPGGLLAVWSSSRNPAFTKRLQAAGFATDEVPLRERPGKGSRHLIWMATKR